MTKSYNICTVHTMNICEKYIKANIITPSETCKSRQLRSLFYEHVYAKHGIIYYNLLLRQLGL